MSSSLHIEEEPSVLGIGDEVATRFNGTSWNGRILAVEQQMSIKTHDLQTGIIRFAEHTEIITEPKSLYLNGTAEIHHLTTGSPVVVTILEIIDRSIYTVHFNEKTVETLQRCSLNLRSKTTGASAIIKLDEEIASSSKKRRTSSPNCILHKKICPMTGMKCFLERLKDELKNSSKSLPSNCLAEKQGEELDIQYMTDSGFDKVILVKNQRGLQMSVPGDEFTYSDVMTHLGPEFLLLVTDEASSNAKNSMFLAEFVEYMTNLSSRNRILNVINLEISCTSMDVLFGAPKIITDISWVVKYFPQLGPSIHINNNPEGMKHLAISAEGCYTDFQINSGGTSTWNYLVKGKEIFLLIKPTEKNLVCFEHWKNSHDRNKRYLGHELDCYTLVMERGHTIMIPSGWIYAIFTLEDSLMVTGKFLHHFAVKKQFRINLMDERINTPDHFQFSNFYLVCWRALKDLIKEIMEVKLLAEWKIKAVIDLYSILHNIDLSPKNQNTLGYQDNETEEMETAVLLRKARIFIRQMAGRTIIPGSQRSTMFD